MQDTHGHRISYLRVSVTDRCNERCRYCMPEEEQEWMARDETLSFDEMLRVIRVGTGLGIRKVRVTGGEPLTRPGVLEFFDSLGEMKADGLLNDIGISTNGTLLSNKPRDGKCETIARRLVESGVRTANLSLDTLDRQAYQLTTGRDFFVRVMDGIDAAIEAKFESIKINCVLMRGRNEQNLPEIVEFARRKGLLLRFIELMPVSTSEVLTEENFFSAGLAKKALEAEYGKLIPMPEFKTNGPASYYQVPGTGQLIGFIGAMTNFHFCESCNKLRLTCDGKLRPCLGSHLEFDMREILRSGASDEDIAKFFLDVVEKKPKEHDFRDNYVPGRKMIAIGG
jgi:cyclic pyranopterin phosphate synthase